MLKNSSIFLEAFLHVPHTLCGRKLKPFCLAHLLVLDHLESPFIAGGSPKLQDVLIAANVCSAGSFDAIQINLGKWGLFDSFYSLTKELPKFEAYYKDFALLPDFISKQGMAGSGVDGLPWSICLVMRALQNSSYTMEQLMFLPLAQLVWITLGVNFIESGETIVETDKDKALLAQLKALGI